MTCGKKHCQNIPTEATRVDPAEVDGRAICDRSGCGKKLRGDGCCVDGHVQGEPPVMADLDGLLDLFDELRIEDASYEMAAPVVYARYAVAVAREGPEVVRTGWVYGNRGATGRHLEDQRLVWADTQEEAVAQANELGCAGDHWELTPLAEYMPQHHDPSFGPLRGTPQELGAAGVRALLALIADAQNDDLWHDPRAVAARNRDSLSAPADARAHADQLLAADGLLQADGGVVVGNREQVEQFWTAIVTAVGDGLPREGLAYAEYDVSVAEDGGTTITLWAMPKRATSERRARVAIYEAHMPAQERWSAQDIARLVATIGQAVQDKVDRIER